MNRLAPLVLINAVGLTSRLLPLAPRLSALAQSGWSRPLTESLPAVTCTAQATLLTGATPASHGIVANGWHFRDTGETRFWQQSAPLIQAEPVHHTLKKQAAAQNRPFRVAKLFWWFNQGDNVDLSVTPKPHYGADGSKVFGIDGNPREQVIEIEKQLGPFPFHTFWGPRSGLPCTTWIARCAAAVLRDQATGPPDLTLVYLPHLDYDPQRHGPCACDMPRLVRELDDACIPLLDAAQAIGARVWVVSEYGHCDVTRPIHPNRILRAANFLGIRPGPFGEILDPFTSRAFAVCDHQLAHVYVKKPADQPRVRDILAATPGIAQVLDREQQAAIHLNHPRSGDLALLSDPDAWFAYPFWIDDRAAPDFARTVDIHRKPGFDPCELFLDPALRTPKLRIARRLIQKKLGFRTLFDVIPLDASLVHGSHGLPAATPEDRPLLIGDGPPPPQGSLPMTAVASLLQSAFSDG